MCPAARVSPGQFLWLPSQTLWRLSERSLGDRTCSDIWHASTQFDDMSMTQVAFVEGQDKSAHSAQMWVTHSTGTRQSFINHEGNCAIQEAPVLHTSPGSVLHSEGPC